MEFYEHASKDELVAQILLGVNIDDLPVDAIKSLRIEKGKDEMTLTGHQICRFRWGERNGWVMTGFLPDVDYIYNCLLYTSPSPRDRG